MSIFRGWIFSFNKLASILKVARARKCALTKHVSLEASAQVHIGEPFIRESTVLQSCRASIPSIHLKQQITYPFTQFIGATYFDEAGFEH